MNDNSRNALFEKHGHKGAMNTNVSFFQQTLVLTSKICNTETACISVIGEEYKYVVSQYGAHFDTVINENSQPQSHSLGNELLIIHNTRNDELTKSLTFISDKERQSIGFYAEMSLLDRYGSAIGVLYVTDLQPKELTKSQQESLQLLGQQVVLYLEMRQELHNDLISNKPISSELPDNVEVLISDVSALTIQLNDQNTVLKRVNLKYKYKSEVLQQVLDTFPGFVSKINREYKYEFVNSRYLELTGIAPELLTGKPIVEVIGEETYNNLLPVYEQVFNGEQISYEGFFDFQGKKRYLKVRYYPSYTKGEVDGAYVLTEDYTEIKTYQFQLENSNKSLENFAHVVSHDIQSPLRTINSFANLLKRDLDKRNIEYNNDYLNFIIDGALNLNQLTTDLLDFAKVKQTEVVHEAISLKELLNIVQLNLSALMTEKKAKVIYTPIDFKISGLLTDFILLFQNLISNAIKYSKPDVAPIVQIECSAQRDSIEFSIIDNGIGIPSDRWKDIFLPFKRVHKISVDGSGVGLATCANIVEKYNSKIYLDSKVNVGSRFSFSLPRDISEPHN